MANLYDLIAEGSASVTSVTTGDAAPTTSPHKISTKATKDSATLRVTMSAEAWYVKVVRGGNSKTGKRLYRRGLMCGGNDRCGPGARSLYKFANPYTWVIPLPFSTVSDGGADGTRNLTVYLAGYPIVTGG